MTGRVYGNCIPNKTSHSDFLPTPFAHKKWQILSYENFININFSDLGLIFQGFVEVWKSLIGATGFERPIPQGFDKIESLVFLEH